MSALSPQLPLDWFEAEPPSFANFLVGHNAELVTRLYALSQEDKLSGVTSLWSGANCGKTHLLSAFFSELNARFYGAIRLNAGESFPESPFVESTVVLIDDADRLNEAQQAWAFNAFNHVVPGGGFFLATGSKSPRLWPVRDDLRTRLASGLIFEVHAAPQDELPTLLAEYAQKRGIAISKEVLTYVLTHTKRDVAALCQTIAGLDRLSLSLKRPITIPLVRAYFAQDADRSATKTDTN